MDFILPFFTRKVRTVTFSEEGYSLSRSQNNKTSFCHFDILAKTRSRLTTATMFSRQNRDFKIQRRGRQGERKKNIRFNKQNNNFARASRFFVHFFPVFARLRRENAKFRVLWRT